MTVEIASGIPDFISADLCRKALISGLNTENIEITSLKISLGTKKGDNYCSEIYRAEVSYHQSNGSPIEFVSLIIKAMPYNDERGPILESLQVYNKEVHMYMDTLPKLSALCDNELFSAKCYYTTEDPVQIIVFQDLCSIGYKMTSRQFGLDLEHCKIVLQKLGKFHAASILLSNQDETVFNKYISGMLPMDLQPDAPLLGYFNLFVEIFSKHVLPDWAGYEDVAKKFTEFGDQFLIIIQKLIYETPKTITVLNHGDLWTNNLLFAYGDDGKPNDVVFVDYQMSVFNSPGIDLNYFLCISPEINIRKNYWDYLIETYNKSFLAILDSKGSHSKFIDDDIKREIQSRAFYGLFASVVDLPNTTVDYISEDEVPTESGGLEERLAIILKSFNTQQCQDGLKYIIDRSNTNGVIDLLLSEQRKL